MTYFFTFSIMFINLPASVDDVIETVRAEEKLTEKVTFSEEVFT